MIFHFRSTTDRPHLFPTSKTVIGFDSDGGEVLFHAAATPKSDITSGDIISGGVDDLNPIELNRKEVDPPSNSANTPLLDLPSHIENLDREAILNEGKTMYCYSTY